MFDVQARRLKRKHCPDCRRNVAAEWQAMRFTGWSALHFGLTLATCGLWLPVLIWSVWPAWVCQRCGGNL